MKDEKFKLFFGDQWQELSLDEIENVTGGADPDFTVEAVCPAGCGFVKVLDDFMAAVVYIGNTKACPKCGYSKERLIMRKKG